MRDPVAAMPSQLSSLRPGLESVGYRQVTDSFRDALVDLTLFYFLRRSRAAHPGISTESNA